MRNPSPTRLCAALLLWVTAHLSDTLPAQIRWEKSFDAAIAKAKAEDKILFIALNMDGERANDQMVSDHYQDDTLVKLSLETVNLFCSNNIHTRTGRCPRCKGPSCAEHRANDFAVRRKILKVDGEVPIVAPQHLFVAPDGAIINSASYFITKGELEWMWARAIKTTRPDFDHKPSGRVRAPEQLRKGAVDSSTLDEKPPTPKEVKESLRTVKKLSQPPGRDVRAWGKFFNEVQTKARTLIRSDDKKALEWGKATMRSYKDLRTQLIEDVGDYAPKAWSKVIEEWLGAKSEETRLATIVALEKLADPKSVAALRSSCRKEEVDEIAGRCYRALATCGPTNKLAIRTVSKAATSHRSALIRAHAVVAAGKLEDRKAINKCLTSAIQDKDPLVRSTAVYAIAVRQDEAMLPRVKALSQSEADPAVLGWATKAIKAVETGDHSTFQKFLAEVLKDHDGRFDAERGARWNKLLEERDKGK